MLIFVLVGWARTPRGGNWGFDGLGKNLYSLLSILPADAGIQFFQGQGMTKRNISLLSLKGDI
jgi:hypothetical protein